MSSTSSKNWRDWPTPPILERTLYDDNPAGILAGLKQLRAKGVVAFHLADLETARRAWAMATMASIGNPTLVIACAEERDKFQFWAKELKNGMLEHQQSGVMILEKKDWPSPHLLDMAIAHLEHAQMEDIRN